MTKRQTDTTDTTEPTTALPRDEFSATLRSLEDHPGSVSKQSTVDVRDWYGNVTTWIVRTIRVESEDTVFIQRQDARSSDRLVLPPKVTSALARHRDGAATASRQRAGRNVAAKRKAAGIVPAFLRAKDAKGGAR